MTKKDIAREADKTRGATRSSQWPTVRRNHLKANPACAVCGEAKKVQVHHKRPFHLHPELELDPTNLITLCEKPGRDCHLVFGHAGDFKGYNPSVEADALAWRLKFEDSRKLAGVTGASA